MAKTLFIIVPCYNEESCLPQTAPIFLKKLQELVQKNKISDNSRIFLVNDGSIDKTWEIIKKLHTEHPEFTGLSLKKNRGHQNALMAALMEAKDRCDFTISIDADLQDDLNAVDQMVDLYLEGFPIVCGVRNSRQTDAFMKRFTARAFYRLMNLFGAKIIYDHADFRLMSKDALKRLSYYHGDDLFLRGLSTRLGLPYTTTLYNRSSRVAGESKYSLKKMLILAQSGFSCKKCKPHHTQRMPDIYIQEKLYN